MESRKRNTFWRIRSLQKVKVKLSLCFNWEPRHEGVLGVEYSSTHSLASALDGGEWSAPRLNRFTTRERAPSTHWIGSWVGTEPVWTWWWRGTDPLPAGTRTPDHPTRSLAYTDWAITALEITTYANSKISIYNVPGNEAAKTLTTPTSATYGNRQTYAFWCY
jgi:hypothetical protein